MSDEPFDIQSLIRPAVSSRLSYVPATGAAKKPDKLIRLDMNESPYGPGPRTRATLADFVQTNRYPDFAQTALRNALSDYTGLAPSQIVCGAGLDDVFVAVAMALIEPGDEVIISEPTFGVYRPLFELHGAVVVGAPLAADFAFQPDSVIDAVSERTKLIIICCPNNPTGNLFPIEDIERVASSVKCLVAIDEAYVEFSGQSHIPLMASHPNIMILRTMSKWAGLAGMRVGYGLCPIDLAPAFLQVVPPFHNVALASSECAIASLEERDFLLDRVAQICADRDVLIAQINAIDGVTALPSVTNFILISSELADARPLVDLIAARGVLVRAYGDDVLRGYLRVSVGSPPENDAFVAALQSALEELAG
jgi:histidinol-phosphate aminotransferase